MRGVTEATALADRASAAGTRADRPVPPAAPGPSPAAPRLVVPPDWELTEVSHARLRRLLRTADGSVAGVIAPLTSLPAGASHLTVAERAALRPPDEVARTVATQVRGAVLVRPGVEAEAALDRVRLDRGTYLIDLGATCHDPWAPQPRPGVASPLGRPPFRRRPVVVVVSCEGAEEIADWARPFVNGLLRNGAEGRFAGPEPAHGLHLFAPCSASAASLAALAPDLVVVTDDTAAALVPRWVDGNRATTLLRFDPDTRQPIELASWRRDRHAGRHRGVLGRGADTKQVARLASRLLAGPLPTPPTGASAPPALAAGRGPSRPRAGRRVAVLGSLDGALGGTAGALVELLAEQGHTVAREPLAVAGALTADLVVVAGRHGSATTALLRRRRARGRSAVLLVGDHDLTDDGATGAVGLSPPALALGRACGAVVISECVPLGAGTATRLGAPTLHLPLLGGSSAPTSPSPTAADPGPARIGWFVGGPGGPGTDGAATALAALGADGPLHVDLVDEAGTAPESALPRSSLPGATGAVTVAACSGHDAHRLVGGWSALVWTPALGRDGSAVLVAAARAGVPVVAPTDLTTPARGVPVSPSSAVSDAAHPGGWEEVLRSLLHDAATARQARSWTAAWAASALSVPSSLATVDRLLGWLDRVHRGGRV